MFTLKLRVYHENMIRLVGALALDTWSNDVKMKGSEV